MPDVRHSELPSLKVIRPGHKFGPKPPKNPIEQVSCSALGAFSVCPQLHGFGYDLGLRPGEDKDALVLGTLIHVGLAYRYAMRMNPRPEWLVYPSKEAPDPRHAIWTIGQDRHDMAAEALRIFDAYQAYYTIPRFWPLVVEEKFETVIPVDGVPTRYTLRLDMLAYDVWAGNEIVYVDHKSTFKLSKWVGRDYRADREMITALALARLYGYDVKRVIINAMTKVKDIDGGPKFERYDVPISQGVFARIGEETAYWIRQMRAVKAQYPDPTNRPRVYESCMRKYGRCDFYPICADGDQNISMYTRKWA